MKADRRMIAIMAALIVGTTMLSAEPLPEGVDPATGFRMDNYRAPTPGTVPGGVVVDTQAVKAAVESRSHVLIDAYAKGVVADPQRGWVVTEPRSTIPEAVWLPGIGVGELKPEAADYFRSNLERLTGGDKAHGVVFFCMADCWHSWNASKRAAEWGYTGVSWYPLGTDGWTEAGETLAPATPVPISRETL